MNCPVCKYPNPQGATHCGMCYEVFNRSAAQAYLHAVKRERRQTEKKDNPQPVIPTEGIFDKATAAFQKVDWSRLIAEIFSLLNRLKGVLLIGLGLVGLWVAASFLFSANLWYFLLGKKFEYAFPEKAPAQYLVILTDDIKCWSERNGRLDTPLEQYKRESFGNVLFYKKKAVVKNRLAVALRAREWIEIRHDAQGSTSHTIPLNHPSLLRTRVIFDKKGMLIGRHYTLSPRLAKGLPFLTPKFPAGTLRRGRTWTEYVEWIDMYSDWKIYWAGTLYWTLGDLEPCAGGTCAKLTYQADLRPQLWAWPSWAAKAVQHVQANVSAEGSALFDTGHKRLVSNTFTYSGLLYLPITNLGRIPWELRIGRGVKGPGEIVIRLGNKIDIHKN